MRSVGISGSGGENLEPLKGLNILKVENDDSNRTLGIELEGISARLREDELLGSTHYLLHLGFAGTILRLIIHLGIETCHQILMEMIMRS